MPHLETHTAISKYWNFGVMHPSLLLTALAALTSLSGVEALRSNAKDKALLSKVQSLTLRDGQKTSARRVSAIPQVFPLLPYVRIHS